MGRFDDDAPLNSTAYSDYPSQVRGHGDDADNQEHVGSIPASNISTAGDIVRIDSRASTHNGADIGATSGIHRYIFSGTKNTIDVASGSTIPANLRAIANATIESGVATKSIDGYSWNSAVMSNDGFDPREQDFAVSWLVESVSGTIREMAGLDDEPSVNNSYSSIEHAIYQVNNQFYSRVYEKGAAIMTDNASKVLKVGDRLGVKVINGVVSYFIIADGEEIVVYTSQSLAAKKMYFKAALNRGGSDASVLGDVRWHVEPRQTTYSVMIEGQAQDIISDIDKEKCLMAGIELLADARYCDLSFSRVDSPRFNDDVGGLYDIEMVHSYRVFELQDVQIITTDSVAH